MRCRQILTSAPGRLRTRQLVRARIPELFWPARLDQIPDNCPHKPILQKFVANITTSLRRGLGLYLFGDYGTGKSSAAAICAKAAIAHGATVLYIRGGELRSIVIDKPPFDEDETLLERMGSVDLLVLDDPDGAGDTPWARGVLEQLLRTVRGKKQSLIIANNFAPTVEASGISPRAFSILREFMIPVHVRGVEWRGVAEAALKAEFEA